MGLSPIEVINLANEFIIDTEHKLLLKQYQRHHGILETSKVTTFWYKGFVKWYKECLKTKLSKNVAFDRLKRATFDNIHEMYVLTYDLLVDGRIAVKKDKAISFTKEGKIAVNIAEKHGRPTLYHLIHPEFFLFVDASFMKKLFLTALFTIGTILYFSICGFNLCLNLNFISILLYL